LLRFEGTLAFGAFFRVDNVDLTFEPDRTGGAFELAGTALGALGRYDPEGHF
jgi:hypothetical protein